MYWSHDEDVHNEAIAASMTRNCFCEIMKYLHGSDNANRQTDNKMSKVRPLLSMVKEKFIHYFQFLKTHNLSIDESMVPYYGRHSAKQFIRGKPIRFGYKMLQLHYGMWCTSSLTKEHKGGKPGMKDSTREDLFSWI